MASSTKNAAPSSPSIIEDTTEQIVEPILSGAGVISASHKVELVLPCPPDKSLTHRAVIFSAMAKGQSKIIEPLTGADCRSTAECFRQLGVEIQDCQSHWIVKSPGRMGWQAPTVPLDFGNSGTSARLLTGLFAATPGFFTTAFGDASLSSRPMGRVVKPLRSVGAKIYGREDGMRLPLAIVGQGLRPGSHVVDKASAQVKSAILLAGTNIDGPTTVRLPRGGRNHTEVLLKNLGANISVESAGTNHDDEVITIHEAFLPPPRDYHVGGDPSSAAFLIVLGALLNGRTIVVPGVINNKTRSGFVEVLRRMGANIKESPEAENLNQAQMEPTVTITIRGNGGMDLRGVDIEPNLVPTFIDEVPILAVAALFAEGQTRFRDLTELRVKESDRLHWTAKLLQTLSGSGSCTIEGDDLIVFGKAGRAIDAFSFSSQGDHRLAMAAAVAGKIATKPCKIIGSRCVDVSFPGFFECLSKIK